MKSGSDPKFWLLHTGGWLAYGVAMTLSRIGVYTLSFMVVVKGILMVSGFLLSLGLRYLYRPLIRRGTPLVTLVEENGYFYGRGSIDDKAMAAMLVDTLIRFQRSGYKPKRTVKLAQ